MNYQDTAQNKNLQNTSSNNDFKITFAPLSLTEIYQQTDDAQNGAVVIMSGTVRNQTEGKKVMYLEYQAYTQMALNIFQEIANNIYQKWSNTNKVTIHHRVGKLQIGDISVLVAVGCPHRKEAFEACQYAIDTLKHNAPIWKKEHFKDGVSNWVSINVCEENLT